VVVDEDTLRVVYCCKNTRVVHSVKEMKLANPKKKKKNGSFQL
jgi:hypothetical protein